eukprot:scaffold91799_cov63-Phaeocystis_antarctica.AAC.4
MGASKRWAAWPLEPVDLREFVPPPLPCHPLEACALVLVQSGVQEVAVHLRLPPRRWPCRSPLRHLDALDACGEPAFGEERLDAAIVRSVGQFLQVLRHFRVQIVQQLLLVAGPPSVQAREDLTEPGIAAPMSRGAPSSGRPEALEVCLVGDQVQQRGRLLASEVVTELRPTRDAADGDPHLGARTLLRGRRDFSRSPRCPCTFAWARRTQWATASRATTGHRCCPRYSSPRHCRKMTRSWSGSRPDAATRGGRPSDCPAQLRMHRPARTKGGTGLH